MAAPIFLLFFQGSGEGLPEIEGEAQIVQAPDTLASTSLPGITGTGQIVEKPDTTAKPEDEDDFVTYGFPMKAIPKVRPPLTIVRRKSEAPKLRKLNNESIKLKKEYERLQNLAEQARQAFDDEIAMDAIREEAKKSAAQFARVAGDYLSIDKRRKMMAMMLALLME